MIAGPYQDPESGESYNCVLYTVYGGPIAEREVGCEDNVTQEDKDKSAAFWAEHALGGRTRRSTVYVCQWANVTKASVKELTALETQEDGVTFFEDFEDLEGRTYLVHIWGNKDIEDILELETDPVFRTKEEAEAWIQKNYTAPASGYREVQVPCFCGDDPDCTYCRGYGSNLEYIPIDKNGNKLDL